MSPNHPDQGSGRGSSLSVMECLASTSRIPATSLLRVRQRQIRGHEASSNRFPAPLQTSSETSHSPAATSRTDAHHYHLIGAVEPSMYSFSTVCDSCKTADSSNDNFPTIGGSGIPSMKVDGRNDLQGFLHASQAERESYDRLYSCWSISVAVDMCLLTSAAIHTLAHCFVVSLFSIASQSFTSW